MNSRLFLSLLVTLVLGSGHGQSVPGLISYQGKLTDQSGKALEAGSYGLYFRVWASPQGTDSSDLVWSRAQPVSIGASGAFNVILGGRGAQPVPGDAPLVEDLAQAFGGPNRYLGISLASHEGKPFASIVEILPRQQLLSTPYAVVAARLAQGSLTSSNVDPALLMDILQPPGTVIAFMGTNTTSPAGWEFCWGQALSRTDPRYARLFATIGTSNGEGDGSTTFNLPDLRGVFLRGVTGGRTNASDGSPMDPDVESRVASGGGGNQGNQVGSYQPDAFQGHQHNSLYGWGSGNYGTGRAHPLPADVAPLSGIATAGYHPDQWEGNYGSPRRTSETRPKNVNVQYLIKL